MLRYTSELYRQGLARKAEEFNCGSWYAGNGRADKSNEGLRVAMVRSHSYPKLGEPRS